ncbi:hypothetical protein PAEPH01_2230 [Pancytospora epiphaga]|nr:hypothetical protein PAEPH01_2230 [Pancytospora epiphaga]
MDNGDSALRMLCYVETIQKLEKDIEKVGKTGMNNKYIKNKLIKYLNKAYVLLAEEYRPELEYTYYKSKELLISTFNKEVTNTEPQDNKQNNNAIKCTVFSLTSEKKWLNIDLFSKYSQKVEEFYRKYPGTLKREITRIKQKYQSSRKQLDVTQKLMCTRRIYKYIHKYIEFFEKGAKKYVRINNIKNEETDTDKLYCKVCNRGIVRKMIDYHLKSKGHKRFEKVFKGKKKIVNMNMKFKDENLLLKRYKAAIKRMMRSISKSNKKKEVRKVETFKKMKKTKCCYFCQVCISSFVSSREYLKHFTKSEKHIEELRKKGIENIKKYVGVYTLNGVRKMAMLEIKREDDTEVEDNSGNVYSKGTYEDLINNKLLS